MIGFIVSFAKSSEFGKTNKARHPIKESWKNNGEINPFGVDGIGDVAAGWLHIL